MKKNIYCIILSLCFFLSASVCISAPDSLSRVSQKWKADLPDILKRQIPIRVLVSYNRTNFFTVKGDTRGMEHDLMQGYRKYLSDGSKTGSVRMVFIALPFDELIPALLEGRGDIIAAGLTVTSARGKKVLFSTPYLRNISEVIVGSAKATPILQLTDLAGKSVYVRAGSSYISHLESVSVFLEKKKLKPIKIVQVDKHLETEDLLQMAERGMIEYTVADNHVAAIWKAALPGLQLFNKIPIHSGGNIAWAVHPDDKLLEKSLSNFVETVRPGTLLGNMTFKRYFINTSWVKNPAQVIGSKTMMPVIDVFKKYAQQYGFDWLKLLALAYQESGLDMTKSSNRGAVGIMQIKPSTAADRNINVAKIDTLDGNVHAGVKYLRFLRDRYFKDVSEESKVDFALAAYNAGPGRIIKLRKQAEIMGLDPNKWFGNVEYAAYKEIGAETPTYVANVQMNYAFYKSVSLVLEKRHNAKK